MRTGRAVRIGKLGQLVASRSVVATSSERRVQLVECRQEGSGEAAGGEAAGGKGKGRPQSARGDPHDMPPWGNAASRNLSFPTSVPQGGQRSGKLTKGVGSTRESAVHTASGRVALRQRVVRHSFGDGAAAAGTETFRPADKARSGVQLAWPRP